MSVKERIQELIAAVHDVTPAGSGGPVRTIAGASVEHQTLFDSYVRELHAAKQTADLWWQGLIDTEESQIGDRRNAEINVKLRRPAGCVVHPGVIHTIRHFWLECLRGNEDLPQKDRVAPEAFVLLWLEQAGERDIAKFVATIPYWPIGMDEQGNWI